MQRLNTNGMGYNRDVPTASRPTSPAWFRALARARVISGAPPEITDVAYDSRRVTMGSLFVAVPGFRADGHQYIEQAIGAGASAVIVQEDRRRVWQPLLRDGVAFVSAPDARVALAEAAAAFFGYPARSLGVAGVTGTDGKTTTTHLTAHVLTATGRPAGYLSSVAFATSAHAALNVSHMTTLEAPDVQRQLAAVRDGGDRYAVVEASSIGLDLHRVDQCEFDVAVFTNIAPDHLDYHRDMATYLEAKATLFRMLDAATGKAVPKAAILNADDPASDVLREATDAPACTYGLVQPADISARDIAADGYATTFTTVMFGLDVRGRVPLPGAYNVANALAAVAVAVAQGATFGAAVAALESFAGVPGRMEQIDEGQPFRVIVDIASTEQAMRNVLSVLRPVTAGKIIVVFGAAGERDAGRRSGIARAVAEAADYAVVTNEDPRSEDPDAIIDDIARALIDAGCAEGSGFSRLPDRREAIARAFERAGAGDTVVLAGKATEPSIVIASEHVPWDERETARELLRSFAKAAR